MWVLLTRGGSQMVSVLNFYSDDPSSNTDEVYFGGKIDIFYALSSGHTCQENLNKTFPQMDLKVASAA